ncbi:CocE/NonD family hydrolase [Nocardia jiangsuensis]|uniref:CocE/NonD family hydrolase n=1 Tax=Nocardia jiangsuensis TaxID=1691563 RepID=A0ABV8E2S5_9NOCA
MTIGTVIRALAGALLVLGVVVPVTAAQPQPAFQWREEYLTAPDGTRLHADILRPAGLADDVRTPVIMTVSPYRNQLAYLTLPRPQGGPVTDYLAIGALLEAGYTYVIVDLRGFAGSSGCPDFGGPGERGDVRTAVEWAADAPWSTGRVGLYGVSYEGWTGVMGLAERPRGLAAVATFGPVVDPYSYLYMQGVSWRFSGKPVVETGIRPADGVGLEHLLFASIPGHWNSSPEYRANAGQIPLDCYLPYLAETANHDPGTAFWRERELVEKVRGSTTPVFLGQGLVDYNTRPYRVFDFWDALGPGEHRAWFGQWGHRDCQDKCAGPDFTADMRAFFDRHVAGRDVELPGPRITVNAADGSWRGEQRWPPADAARVPVPLRTGSYTHRGLLPGPDREIWTISEPLPTPQHLAGIPTATLRLDGPPAATVAMELYDVEPSGRATVITRGIAPVSATARIRLLAQDWPIAAGHRIGIRIVDMVDDVWAGAGVNAPVTVVAAEVELPLLTTLRSADLPGGAGVDLIKWKAERVLTLGPGVVENASVPLNLPAPSPAP